MCRSIYEFVEPDAGIGRVTIYLNGSVSPLPLEEKPPFGLVGALESDSGFAERFEPNSLPSGRHRMRRSGNERRFESDGRGDLHSGRTWRLIRPTATPRRGTAIIQGPP